MRMSSNCLGSVDWQVGSIVDRRDDGRRVNEVQRSEGQTKVSSAWVKSRGSVEEWKMGWGSRCNLGRQHLGEPDTSVCLSEV